MNADEYIPKREISRLFEIEYSQCSCDAYDYLIPSWYISLLGTIQIYYKTTIQIYYKTTIQIYYKTTIQIYYIPTIQIYYIPRRDIYQEGLYDRPVYP